MFNRRFTYNYLFLVIIAFLIQIYSAEAQVNHITIKDSVFQETNNRWYHQENYQFQIQYPKLQFVPPLSTGMDIETLISYIFLDSLLRTFEPKFLSKNYFNYWEANKSKNDSVKALIKYFYKLIDYDPVRFYKYKYGIDGKYYHTGIQYLQSSIYNLLASIIRNTSNANTMNDLIQADYILRVHVNSVDSLPYREYGKNMTTTNQYMYQINVSVIDTLKGKVFNQCNNNSTLSSNIKKNSIQTNNSTLCFNHITGTYTNDKYLLGLKNDLGLQLVIKPDQELIIFISHCNHLLDYNFDYLSLSLNRVFPIINGKVSDVNKRWSENTLIDYLDWKNLFNEKVNLLLNGGY